MMRVAILAPLVVLAFGSCAIAGEKTLSYQAVMHVVESHAADVLDIKSHQIGIGRFRGLAIFPGEDIAVHRYEGWFDLIDGSGRYEGYMLWKFEDGAQIQAQYEGTVREAGPTDFPVEATVHGIFGTGRFAGISGTGTFIGRRLEPIENGGDTYVSGTLNVSLPD
jgi:hypothetical protein